MTDNVQSNKTRPRLPQVLLVLLLLFHLCANIWWLRADNHAVQTDEETHMIMAREYYDALFPQVGDQSLEARWRALLSIKTDLGNPVHPPLLHITGALLVRIIGYSVDGLAFVNTLSFLLAILGVYLLARKFLDEAESFFATLVFSFTPMIYMSSRFFMTDFLSTALVVWIIYALVQTRWFTQIRWSLASGALMGLALLTRTTIPLYCFIPGLLVYVVSMSFLVEKSSGRRILNRPRFRRLLLNTVLIFAVGLAICSPWYIVHGGEFYDFWVKKHSKAGNTPLAMVRYEAPKAQPATTSQAATVPGEDTAKDAETNVVEKKEPAAEPVPASASAAGSASGRLRILLRRNIDWVRYPVFIVNNAVFLPLFAMALLGMVLCTACAQFRKRFIPWLLLAWLLGSYVMLTLLLSFATPRYVLQALPALAVLATLPVLALPKGRLRLAAQGLFIAVLVFQYGNLTVHAYGPLAEAKLPVILDHEYQAIYDDPGLYFYKPVLHGSFSYGCMQAPVKENFKDRLFFAMLKAEQERPFYGIAANYARLNIRGMLLDERHFWLEEGRPNPFLRKDIPEDLFPYRNLKNYGWGRELEEVLPTLALVDYVAYTTEGVSEEKEQQWLKEFDARGFELIDRFHEERYGMVPARYFGLLARKPLETLPEPRSLEDIQQLGVEELYKTRRSAIFKKLAPELQGEVKERIVSRLGQESKPTPLNPHADFYLTHLVHIQDDLYVFHLVLFNKEMVGGKYRVRVRGKVAAADMARYFNDHSGQPQEFELISEITPPPALWPGQEVIEAHFPATMFPIPCQLSFSLYNPDTGESGNEIYFGVVDFGKIRHSDK